MREHQNTTFLLSNFQFITQKGVIYLIDQISEYNIVGHIDKLDNLFGTVLSKKPDVLFLETDGNNLSLHSELESIIEHTNTKILLMTDNQDNQTIEHFIKIGVKVMVTPNCSEEEITNALKAVSVGNSFFCNKLLNLVIEEKAARPKGKKPKEISQREFQVLQLITKGYSSMAIAEKLFLSVHTINSHRKNILKKLNLTSPAELIVYALENGIVKKTK
ncbi:response regulator transcription factor [Reichenbachiella sp. MALMAid0571]|uniref:response regulator transcription factor n=1 Tax=Reichenbachiella sp. MALMAid0571 TaxID=3143939 RepID=UPI0032DF82AA